MSKSPNISFIINAHREGMLLVPALRSAYGARAICEERGISVEIVLVGDKVDEKTRQIMMSNSLKIDHISFADYGNLGYARQHALSLSSGTYVCFLDGDDVWQDTWPAMAYAAARSNEQRRCIYHTEVFAGFGTEFFLRHQITTKDTIFHPLHLAATWHYCNNLFAHRSIFEQVPIQPYDHKEGYGSEDWHWSCETLAAGIERDYVAGTVYFYRLDPHKPSLGALRGLVLRPTKLFTLRENLESYSDFTGLSADSQAKDFDLVGRLRRSQKVPSWLYVEAKKATEIDYDIFKLLKHLNEMQVATPKLYPTSAFLLAQMGMFCENVRFGIVGLDCESIDQEQLSSLVHGIRISAKKIKLVVLCGSVLSGGQLIRNQGNILYVNYKMLMEIEGQNPYALNNCLANFISNFKASFIVNFNSEFIDYFSGEYKSFLSCRKLRIARVFFSSINDIGCSYNERRVLAGIHQNMFFYREVWVKEVDSVVYLRGIYSCRDIFVKIVQEKSFDGIAAQILEDASSIEPYVGEYFDKNPFVESRGSKVNLQHAGARVKSSQSMDVTCVLNLHREGDMVLPTLQSLARMVAHAGKRSISVETVIVLDNPDQRTRELIDRAHSHSVLPENTRMIEVSHKDLGRARRSGVEAAEGEYIAFLDGDDLYSKNWISDALSTCRSSREAEVVCHPEINIYFGSDQRIFWHPDEESHKVPYSGLLLENYWTSLSFSKRSVYLEVPHCDIDLENGFGFEDWHWNMEAIARGYVHRVARKTAHFIRLKPNGSLNRVSASRGVVTRPSAFSKHILWNKVDEKRDDVMP